MAAKLGSGGRFAQGVKKIEARNKKKGVKKATNPAGIMAAAGAEKYGQKKMTAMSVAGRKKAKAKK